LFEKEEKIQAKMEGGFNVAAVIALLLLLGILVSTSITAAK
jgi:hypothetical protein